MQPGATPQTGTQTGTSGSNVTGTATGAEGGGVTGQISQAGQTGQIGITETGQRGSQASINATVTATGGQVGVPGAPIGAGHPGIYHGAFVYNRDVPYFIPPASFNSHVIARHKEFLDPRGLSRVRK